MKKEDLFEGFGALDDDLLKRSEYDRNVIKKRKTLSRIFKWGSAAACLAIALWGGTFFIDHKTPEPDTNPDGDIVAERYVDVSTLLVSEEGVVEQALAIKQVEIDGDSALYHKVTSVESNILKENTGIEVESTQDWHKLSGHEDMQYLIFNDNNEYSLWKFDCFQKESYPYNDVLQMIYQIDSAEDITEIIVNPANMDNTDEGKAIQNEIGTTIVNDEKEIEALYHVLSGLTCYGSGNWDKIGLGGDSPSAMQKQVRAGRYLTLVTSSGMEIDTLKYTGISGMFYEYGGVAYSALTKEEKSAIEEILGIEHF